MSLKRRVQIWDVHCGAWTRIHHTAYSQQSGVLVGRGPYSQEDWTLSRQTELCGGDAAAGADQQFLQRAFDIERRKLDSGLRLAGWIERAGIASVLELGCGEMITGWAIVGRLPDLRYVASDFDPFIIQRAQSIRSLDNLEKAVIDVDQVSANTLSEFDLIVAWDVFYALSSQRTEAFLRKVKASGAVFIMCTGQLVGPVRGLLYALRSRLQDYEARCRAGELRDHGFKASVRYYTEIANRCGLDCEIVDTPSAHSTTGDCYFFLRFGC